MRIGPQGIELIKHFESFKAKSYQDQAGIWTIGYGTIKINGVPVKAGMTCTQAQAVQWMQSDLITFEKGVEKLFPGIVFPQHQFDALVCFAYNVGAGALGGSTIRKKIMAKLPVTESNFTAWNKVRISGVLTESNGLTRRRKAEYTLFSANKIQFYF